VLKTKTCGPQASPANRTLLVLASSHEQHCPIRACSLLLRLAKYQLL